MPVPCRVAVVGGEQLTGELLALTLRRRGVFEATWYEHEDGTVLEGAVALCLDPQPGTLRGITQRSARVVAVVTGSAPSAEEEVGLLLGGADAVVPAEIGTDELLRRLTVVCDGGAYVPADRLKRLLDRLRERGPRVTTADDLTVRERQILLSIDRGESVKQTARSLGISPKTVENLQSKLFTKLGARNRAQAVSHAHELGLLGDGGTLLEREDGTRGLAPANGSR